MSLDRFQFFHPRVGEFCVRCTASGNKYYTTVSTEMVCEVDFSKQGLLHGDTKTDLEFFNEFLQLRVGRDYLRTLLRNKLAFPAIQSNQRGKIDSLIRHKNIDQLIHYVKENNLFKDSITTPEFLEQ